MVPEAGWMAHIFGVHIMNNSKSHHSTNSNSSDNGNKNDNSSNNE